MIKIGTVLQSLVNSMPLRQGNTYRVSAMTDDTFTIRYFSGTVPYSTKVYSIGELHTIFKIIPDTLCPSCLKSYKDESDNWCVYCSGHEAKYTILVFASFLNIHGSNYKKSNTAQLHKLLYKEKL